MRRRQLFEIHDWSWCPQAVRNGLTDFLQTSIDFFDTYEPIRKRLLAAIAESGSSAVVDMCSGGGGPWMKWARKGIAGVPVTLSDKFPNARTIEWLEHHPIPNLKYCPASIDATAVSSRLPGFRTIFTAFHHFTPEQAGAIIADAVRNGEGIGVFEFTSRSTWHTLGMLLTPLGVLLLAPFGKQVRWQALVLTYLIPVIPLVTCIDGVLSCLRSYSSRELQELANFPEFRWEAGKAKSITYLIGVPLPQPIAIGGGAQEQRGVQKG